MLIIEGTLQGMMLQDVVYKQIEDLYIYFLYTDLQFTSNGIGEGRNRVCSIYMKEGRMSVIVRVYTFNFLSSLTYLASGESGSQSNCPCQKYLVFLVSLTNLYTSHSTNILTQHTHTHTHTRTLQVVSLV